MSDTPSSMSNKSVDDLINEGYTIEPHITENVTVEHALMRGVPQIFVDAARAGRLKFVLLHSAHKEPHSIDYFFFDEPTYQRVKEIIAEKEKVPGIVGWLIIEVTYCRSYDRQEFWMGNFLESLRTQLGWNVSQAHLGAHYIDVQFDEPSIDKEDIPEFRERIEKIILSLSLQYRLGIRIFHFNCAHRGDRLAQFLLGPGEAAAPGFLADEISRIADLLDNKEAHNVAIALQNF